MLGVSRLYISGTSVVCQLCVIRTSNACGPNAGIVAITLNLTNIYLTLQKGTNLGNLGYL